MRTCPRCGSPADDDVDFCSCGAFLDWDAPNDPGAAGGEGGEPAPSPPRASAVTTVVRPPARKNVQLDLIGADGAPGGSELRVSVAAGERVTFIARVRNQSRIVDSYSIAVEGLPEGWCTIGPPTVGSVDRHAETAYLLPLGSREGYEQDVVVALHPPRNAYATAGIRAFSVVATSQTEAVRADRAQAAVDVLPFWEIAAAPRPAVVAGRRRGVLDAGVANTGNVPVAVAVVGMDPAKGCRVKVRPETPVDVVNGTVEAFQVVVTPRRPHPFGRPIDHRLELSAGTVGDPELSAPFLATYRQRPWIPWWALLLALLLAIAGLIVFLLWPHPKKVPDVRHSRSAFVAQKRLEKAGLTLNPTVRSELRPKVRAGTVVAQAPAPGKKVDKGKAVTVVIAAGHGMVRVPQLGGLKVTAADQKLQTHGLTLGAVTPKLAPGKVVGKQLPHAGARRRRGTAVSVVLAKPKPKPKPKNAKTPKKAGAAPVPPASGMKAGAAAAALKKAGFTPQTVAEISTVKRGDVIKTVPAKGDPPPADGIVKLIVSLGFPRLAFDTDVQAATTPGADGRSTKGVSVGAEVATGGAWSPLGTQVVFTKAGKLYLKPVAPRKRARHIALPATIAATSATFAPTLDRTVVAFVDSGGATGPDRVCWLDLTGGQVSGPSCLAAPPSDPAPEPQRVWRLTRLAWSPGGKTLLVSAADRLTTPDHRFGLLRLKSTAAFSANRATWTFSDRLVTPSYEGHGALAAAYSPDRKKLAVVTNLRTPEFRVALVKPNEDKLDKPFKGLPLVGCDVAWRPDGAELAVVQAGASCADPSGSIVRASIADPRMLQTVVFGGRHPAWQPIDFNLGPERSLVPGKQR